ncbi:radical SAM protein [Streptomyces sp. GMY01]|uniref:radical SAM protein n=1 Tax=Streptomyces sp. GMY02 TaxID=1333528 RepID=UPI00146F651C|nr:radical SAM protein [Streptomyces sp. GMY02]NMO33710.1 radical SAM protein [Streptomyces sp. GMY02]
MTTATTPIAAGIRSIELEITGRCQLQCTHCCTDSGPKAGSGAMTREDWTSVITDVAALGIPAVQFIGGEPTLTPYLPQYIDHALALGLRVEVYSNLTHVRPGLWAAFSKPGVCLATSYYSDQAQQHEEITRGPGSYRRTRDNIAEAVQRGIPLRVGIVDVLEGQRVDQAQEELRRLGVTSIKVDRVRKVGRAANQVAGIPSTSELCGNCFRYRVSIDPDGAVSGCILSRFLVAGNVREQRLEDILGSDRWQQLTDIVPLPRAGCTPDDSSDCDPANTEACDPAYYAPDPTPSLGVSA